MKIYETDSINAPGTGLLQQASQGDIFEYLDLSKHCHGFVRDRVENCEKKLFQCFCPILLFVIVHNKDPVITMKRSEELGCKKETVQSWLQKASEVQRQ